MSTSDTKKNEKALVSFRLSPDIHKKLQTLADENKRSKTGQLEWLILQEWEAKHPR
jgi:predicted transcriptional regulator